MNEIRPDHLDECVTVTAIASRVADLDDTALRLARSAFEAYKDPERGWVTAGGRKLHAVRRGFIEPHTVRPERGEVVTWQVDYLVGTDRRDCWDTPDGKAAP